MRPYPLVWASEPRSSVGFWARAGGATSRSPNKARAVTRRTEFLWSGGELRWSNRSLAFRMRRNDSSGKPTCPVGLVQRLVRKRRPSRREAAVDREAGTGHEAGLGARKIRDHGRDLVSRAEARQGHVPFQGLGILAVRRVQLRAHRPRLNVVDGNAARAEVACQALDQAHQGGLAHRIDGTAREG